MNWMLLIKIFVLQTVVFGVIIFVMKQVFFSSTEGAVQRLNKETEEARAKQAELDRKIKEANEELEKRRKEAEELAKKMIDEANEKAKEERAQMIQKARNEGEEIIDKAQRTKDQIRKDIEKEIEIKTVTFASEILCEILSEEARGILEERLWEEFIKDLENVDMKQISSDVKTVEIVTAGSLDESINQRIFDIIEKKLGRSITVSATTDKQMVAGIMLKFGSLALDGSIKNLIIEASTRKKDKIEGA